MRKLLLTLMICLLLVSWADGQSWTGLNTNWGFSSPRSLAVTTNTGTISNSTVYATDGTALLVSTNAGKDWGSLTHQPPFIPTVVACRYDNASVIVAGNSSNLYYTTNSGSNWTASTFTGNT